jgi:hypothetical protein
LVAISIAAGMLLTGGSTAEAGQQGCIINSPTPQGTQIITGRIQALQQPICTPTRDVPIKTNTPTPEPTEEATNTPAPVPSNTAVPPTNTPSGDAGAGGVTPPNTGTGDAQSTSGAYGILAIGALLALAGAGSLAAGVRRRS